MNIYVWGTGIILARILNYRIKIDDIAAFIDSDKNKAFHLGKRVIRPNEIPKDYDAIIVATMHTEEIWRQCLELGLDFNKVCFLYNNIQTRDINSNYMLLGKILGTDYADIVKNRYHLVRTIALDETKSNKNEVLEKMPMYQDDYVRVKTLELAACEINKRNIEGDLAELGVYKGEFARCMNAVFPERTLYLFDTFEGFEVHEANNEMDKGSCTKAFVDAFKNANIESLINKMPYPQRIVVRKGYFPDTAAELDNKYALVSLDVDFEESTFNGLEFFYPRLSEGGYLFIHDYNYGYFDCVQKAIDRYEKIHQIKLCKVPICDSIGTLVITK